MNSTISTPTVTVEASPQRPWQEQVSALLERAAAMCAEHEVDLEAFMKGAWTAYVESRPGLREHLEEAELRQRLTELRTAGRVGTA